MAGCIGHAHFPGSGVLNRDKCYWLTRLQKAVPSLSPSLGQSNLTWPQSYMLCTQCTDMRIKCHWHWPMPAPYLLLIYLQWMLHCTRSIAYRVNLGIQYVPQFLKFETLIARLQSLGLSMYLESCNCERMSLPNRSLIFPWVIGLWKLCLH